MEGRLIVPCRFAVSAVVEIKFGQGAVALPVTRDKMDGLLVIFLRVRNLILTEPGPRSALIGPRAVRIDLDSGGKLFDGRTVKTQAVIGCTS